MLGLSFLGVIISQKFRWLLRQGQSQRFEKKIPKKFLKIYFHFASVLGERYRLGQKNLYGYQGDRSRD